VGALYLDQGFAGCQAFLETHLLVHLQNILDEKLWLDPKSRFQEAAQERVGITPSYKVLNEECSNEFSPLGCSDVFSIEQGESYELSYKAVNNGTYDLEQCYISSPLNWIEASISNFDLNISESRDFSVVYTAPALNGVYYDFLFLYCLKGDILENAVTSPPQNRPINKINVISPSGDGDNPYIPGGGSSNSNTPSSGEGTEDYDLETNSLSDIIINPGESEKMSVSVKNIGANFLNLCKVVGTGDNAESV